jgi:hypothetical protein
MSCLSEGLRAGVICCRKRATSCTRLRAQRAARRDETRKAANVEESGVIKTLPGNYLARAFMNTTLHAALTQRIASNIAM